MKIRKQRLKWASQAALISATSLTSLGAIAQTATTPEPRGTEASRSKTPS